MLAELLVQGARYCGSPSTLTDSGVDVGLRTVPGDMSRLLTIVAIATGSNPVDWHGVQVWGQGIWVRGRAVFLGPRGREDGSGRADGIPMLEHPPNVNS